MTQTSLINFLSELESWTEPQGLKNKDVHFKSQVCVFSATKQNWKKYEWNIAPSAIVWIKGSRFGMTLLPLLDDFVTTP